MVDPSSFLSENCRVAATDGACNRRHATRVILERYEKEMKQSIEQDFEAKLKHSMGQKRNDCDCDLIWPMLIVIVIVVEGALLSFVEHVSNAESAKETIEC